MGPILPREIPLLLAAAILVIGVADDLLYRKYHNNVFLASTLAALVGVTLASGWAGLGAGLIAALVGLLLALAPTLLGVIGGGDLKLLVAVAICGTWIDIAATIALSVFWGALFGVLQVLTAKRLGQLVTNFKTLVVHQKLGTIEPHRIPYTVAILLGWLTHQSLIWQGVTYDL